MSCYKCWFWPCDRTSLCPEGTYWIKDRYGRLMKVVEPSEPTKTIISRAVIKALESEV